MKQSDKEIEKMLYDTIYWDDAGMSGTREAIQKGLTFIKDLLAQAKKEERERVLKLAQEAEDAGDQYGTFLDLLSQLNKEDI